MFLRGAEIFAFGLLFRLQEFLIAWGWAPWSDLLRVDVLNIIGLSLMLMALLTGIILRICGADSHRNLPASVSYQGMPSGTPQISESNRGFSRCHTALVCAAIAIASIIALLTPPLYTTWRPTWLPWSLESYIDGCHNLGTPQPWLFPLFPWAAFAFTGMAAGFVLFSDRARANVTRTLITFASIGTIAIFAAWQLDSSRFHLYSTYDYWHTSPNFLLTRIGLVLVICFMTYSWCQWGLATRGFSPIIQLGKTSLLVYWVHIEFVYGRFSLLLKRAESIATASRGLLEIFIFMLILSLFRTRFDWKRLSWKSARRVQPA
jgi:hypothetical protein